jgi:hypothetical protein
LPLRNARSLRPCSRANPCNKSTPAELPGSGWRRPGQPLFPGGKLLG